MRNFNVFTSCELSTLQILGYNPTCFNFIACLATGFAITEFTSCMVEATMLDKSVDKSENGLHLSKNSAQLLGASSTTKFRPSVHYRSINQSCAKLSMQLFASKSHMPEEKTSESRVTRDEHVKMRGLSNCSGHSLSVQSHCLYPYQYIHPITLHSLRNVPRTPKKQQHVSGQTLKPHPSKDV